MVRRPEDYSRRATRPSLLTPAQQAEAARNRILTNLEDGNRPARRYPGLWRALPWLVGLMLVAGASGAWWWLRAPAMADASRPASRTVEREPAGSPWRVPDDRPPTAAAIQDEAPATAPAPAMRGRAPLTAEANAGPGPKARAASQQRRHKIDRKLVQSQTTAVAADPNGQADAERDVALLQALVAHEQGVAASPPDRCRPLAPAAALRCRQRLCRGRAEADPACAAPAP